MYYGARGVQVNAPGAQRSACRALRVLTARWLGRMLPCERVLRAAAGTLRCDRENQAFVQHYNELQQRYNVPAWKRVAQQDQQQPENEQQRQPPHLPRGGQRGPAAAAAAAAASHRQQHADEGRRPPPPLPHQEQDQHWGGGNVAEHKAGGWRWWWASK
jgi:hypothetical protein